MIVLYGAFDRHNLGDLLLPHVVAPLFGVGPFAHAALAARDLRRHGGHEVRPLRELCAHPSAALVHVGGEVLTCDAWAAAAMLLPAAGFQSSVAYLEARPRERQAWTRQVLGTDAQAPYLAPPEWQPRDAPVLYVGVGGVDLASRDAALQAEVRRRLSAADVVTVRERATLAWTRANGIAAQLVPDPVATVAQRFGERIARHAGGDVARARSAFPAGYVALQFSAEFGDDATLAEIARELDGALAGSALGVVCFRAGAAPWHDDARLYRRLAARMQARCRVFSSLNIWHLCALIAGSRVCCASSLHARIIATAFGVPRLSIGPNLKCAAYAASWEAPGLPQVVPAEGIAAGLHAAMAVDVADLRRIGDDLAARFERDFDAVIRPALPAP